MHKRILVALALSAASCALAEGQAPPAAPAGAAAIALPSSESPSAAYSFAAKVEGSGRPMILIPGFMASGDIWKATVERFKGKYECHTLTLPGAVGQPAIKAPVLTTLRSDLARYIADSRLERPIIVAHNFGGTLAYMLAIAEPDSVGPMIILDQVPCNMVFHTGDISAQQIKEGAEQMRQGMSRGGRDRFMTGLRKRLKRELQSPEALKQVEAWAAASDLEAVIQSNFEVNSLDLRSKVSDIQSPILVLGSYVETPGAQERGLAKRLYEVQLESVPKHELALPANLGHYPMFDNPEWMYAQMEVFLDRAR